MNVDELLTKLVAAAGAEFTTFYYCTILQVNAMPAAIRTAARFIRDSWMGGSSCAEGDATKRRAQSLAEFHRG